MGGTKRRKAGVEEDFGHVDVADSREKALIHQGGPKRYGVSTEPVEKDFSVYCEGVGTGPREKERSVGGGGCLEPAEAPGIDPGQAPPVLHFDFEMGVGRSGGVRGETLPSTRHAEAGEEKEGARGAPASFSRQEGEDQGLAMAEKGPPLERAGGGAKRTPPEIVAERGDGKDPFPRKKGEKGEAGGFDFWKFRHGVLLGATGSWLHHSAGREPWP